MKLWLPLLLFTFPRLVLAQIDLAPAEQFVRQYAGHYCVSPELVAALTRIQAKLETQISSAVQAPVVAVVEGDGECTLAVRAA